MPTLTVTRNSANTTWQYKGDGDSAYTDFVTTCSSAAALSFTSDGTLTVSTVDGGCSAGIRVVSNPTALNADDTTSVYAVIVKCGASGTTTTGYFKVGGFGDFGP